MSDPNATEATMQALMDQITGGAGPTASPTSKAPTPGRLPSAPTPAPPAPSVATAPVRPVAPPAAGQDSILVEDREQNVDLNDILKRVVEYGASDLHLTAATTPMMRVNSEMTAVPDTPVLTEKTIESLAYGILTSRQQAKFEQDLELDLAHTIPGVSRFRVNLMRQSGGVAAVFRVIPWKILSLDSLGMPPVVNSFAHFERGLVLVTGPTGSGKSTTLGSIIDEANRTRAGHIVTIEDPVEFIHTHKRSIINQREVGADTHSFASALKHVLRQDPDIILVGEMRDLETISVALTAAETGHLVFGTLHTQSAPETISRIVDVFPPTQQAQVQTQLAATLQAVLCQTLVPSRQGGRVAASEIMVCTNAIRNLIRKGALHQIESTLQTQREEGMQTMVGHLIALTLEGRISYEHGWEKAPDRAEFERGTGGAAAVARRNEQRGCAGSSSYHGSM